MKLVAWNDLTLEYVVFLNYFIMFFKHRATVWCDRVCRWPGDLSYSM